MMKLNQADSINNIILPDEQFSRDYWEHEHVLLHASTLHACETHHNDLLTVAPIGM
jgi:hypothetical protein